MLFYISMQTKEQLMAILVSNIRVFLPGHFIHINQIKTKKNSFAILNGYIGQISPERFEHFTPSRQG